MFVPSLGVIFTVFLCPITSSYYNLSISSLLFSTVLAIASLNIQT